MKTILILTLLCFWQHRLKTKIPPLWPHLLSLLSLTLPSHTDCLAVPKTHSFFSLKHILVSGILPLLFPASFLSALTAPTLSVSSNSPLYSSRLSLLPDIIDTSSCIWFSCPQNVSSGSLSCSLFCTKSSTWHREDTRYIFAEWIN